jgi:hypothetical protein
MADAGFDVSTSAERVSCSPIVENGRSTGAGQPGDDLGRWFTVVEYGPSAGCVDHLDRSWTGSARALAIPRAWHEPRFADAPWDRVTIVLVARDVLVGLNEVEGVGCMMINVRWL